MNKKAKILDSNILLDYPQIVTKGKQHWVIPMCVLKEIDGLKLSLNQETAKKARKAAVYISKNMNNIDWELYESSKKVDEQLLEITEKKDGVLITNDVALKVQAIAKNIAIKGYSWNEDYTGVKYLKIDGMSDDEYNTILSNLIENGIYEEEDYNFSLNEYFIVPPLYKDDSFSKCSIFKFDGVRFNIIRGKEIENSWCDKIFPKNPEQICLFDALLNEDIKILYAGGVYGSGKTFATHNYAIRELEKERIKKIIYVPNNAYTQNSMELGFLPGC